MSTACPRFGFTVRLDVAPSMNARDAAALMQRFVEHFESLRLQGSGGSRGPVWSGTIWREGSQAAHQDREAILAWTERHPEFIRVELGDIVDLSDDG